MSTDEQDTAQRSFEETVPLVVEDFTVVKEQVTTGTVRVRTVVHEDQQEIDEPLRVKEVEVVRVPVDRLVDGPVADRQDGDTLIISVHREIAVVQRKFQVFEEVHIKTQWREERHREVVRTQRTEAVIERDDHKDL